MADAGPSLRDYLAVLWRHKWYIGLVTAVVLTIALFYTSRQTPLYKASIDVLVLPVNFSPTEPAAQEGSANMVNEVQIATSAPVTQLAAQYLEGAGLPMATISVSTPPSSGLLIFESVSADPAAAKATADAFAKAYLDLRRNAVLNDLHAVSDPIQARIDAINEELARAERSLPHAQSASAQAALQISLGTLFSERSLLEQKLASLVVPGNLSVGAVLRPAELPTAAFSPDLLRTALFALFVGLLLGVGIAFLRDRLDPRLRGRDELEGEAEAPVLGVIPSAGSRIDRHPQLLASLKGLDSPVAEAYRVLRASLSAVLLTDDVTDLVVTSPHSGEGRTAVTMGLAVAFARSGTRVVVVSDDLRSNALKPYFSRARNAGLPGVFKGQVSVQAALIRSSTPNLWGLDAGFDAADFETSITAGAMEKALSDLEDVADLVLIDAPPVLEDAKALSIASLLGRVLLVADASRTTASTVRETKRRLDHVGVLVIGAVLNRSDGARSGAPAQGGRRAGAGRAEHASAAQEEGAAVSTEFGTTKLPGSEAQPATLREVDPHG